MSLRHGLPAAALVLLAGITLTKCSGSRVQRRLPVDDQAAPLGAIPLAFASSWRWKVASPVTNT